MGTSYICKLGFSAPLLLGLWVGSTFAAEPPAPPPPPASPAGAAAIPEGMKQYWFVMLTRGPEAGKHSAEQAQALFRGHMDNMQRWAEAGKLKMAGPFMDGGDWRGIFIVDVPTREQAEQICRDDPAVVAGRLACDIRPWITQKGTTLD